MSLRALFAPQGEGLEVKVQGQLAEWPQKPRLPLSTSDLFFHTRLQSQWRDQFTTFFLSYYNLKLIFTYLKDVIVEAECTIHTELIKPA